MKKNQSTLSVVINTKNAAETLARAIDSVSWADEVLVADMHSLDQTIKIAQQLGVRVLELPEYGRVEPEGRNQANQAARNDWVLQLDADEVVTEALAKQIRSLIASGSQVNAYYLPRKNLIFGQWIQHSGWWPDYQPRLFRKNCLKWIGGVHSKPQIQGKTETLPSDESLAILHYNYHSISDFIERLNRYTSLAATEIVAGNLPDSLNYTQAFSEEFLNRYFYHQGWQDGEMGLLLAYLQSFSQVVQSAKQRELEGTLQKNMTPLPESDFTKLIKDLKYWLADYHVKHDKSLMSKLWWRVRRKVRI